jgi:tetratricopeptide (TPR) repeat protein
VIGAQSRLAGQLDQSVYHLNEAIRKDPENVEAYLELGRTHQDRRQNNQALEIYQMAAKIAPHDYRSYYQAGLALKDIKDYLEAETMFRRAARLAPNEVSIHRQLAAVVALNLVHNRRAVSPAVSDRIE